MKLSLTVNGRQESLDVEVGTSLLHVLREQLGLTGTKEGCAEGECGACTVLRDGKPIDSCIMAAHACEQSEITTIEVIGDSPDHPSELQNCLVESGGIQCGFCTPGFVMVLTALLKVNAAPTDAEIKHALAGNICRCTGYAQIIEAVIATAKTHQ